MSKTECPLAVAGLASREDMSIWTRVNRNPEVPFIHRFQTDRHLYIYDVNTSRILRVAPAVWDIVEDFGAMTPEEMAVRHTGRYEARQIAAAYAAIARMQKEHGLLLAHRPAHITMPYDEAGLRQELQRRRQILILGVTEACNFRCAYCVFSGKYRVRRRHSNRVMDWDTARLAMDEFFRHRGASSDRAISFYGGEPLLNVALIKQCVAYVRDQPGGDQLMFAMSTNGSLLAGETADFLAGERFALMISLDGPPQVHDRGRRFQDGSPTWSRVVANIRTFLDGHPEYKTNGLMGFNAVVTPPADLLELEAFFRSCDFLTEEMNLSLGWVFSNDSRYLEDLAPEDRRVEGLAALYERYVSHLEDGQINENHRAVPWKLQAAIFERAFLQFHKRGVSTSRFPIVPDHFCALPTCIPGGPRLFVAADGTYYVCDRSPETDFLRIGHVRDGIDVSKVRQILDEFVNLGKEECRFCWCLPTCSAGCVLTVMEKGRLSPTARRDACAAHRETTHRTLRSICRVLEKDPQGLDYLGKINLS